MGGGRVQRWQGVDADGGDVVSGTGLDVADPHRVSGRVGQHPDVLAVLLVLARVPQVTSCAIWLTDDQRHILADVVGADRVVSYQDWRRAHPSWWPRPLHRLKTRLP